MSADAASRGTKRKRKQDAGGANGQYGSKLERILAATGTDGRSGGVLETRRRSESGRGKSAAEVDTAGGITSNGASKQRYGNGKVGTGVESHPSAPTSATNGSITNGMRPVSSTAQINGTEPKTLTSSTGSELPILAHRDSIIAALSKCPVLVLSGETGSGKSTQLPQFLLNSPAILPSSLRIAVTQPRRVAAISLARRVASEMHTALGKAPTAKVGYSVRFDSAVGRANRLVYLTEGMLLQELLRDPGLCGYAVVVVDEVHERGVNVDLLLGFLRELVGGRGKGAAVRKKKGLPELKVVVMSATADVETLSNFFAGGLHGGMEGVKRVKVEGRQFPVRIEYLLAPVQDYAEQALKTIFQIHCKEPMPGDVLVFMTGQEAIQSLQRNIEEYAGSLDRSIPKMIVLPIYAALTQAAQQRVFEPAPANTRKIILATNIAETSITVPGVRFVVDCGKEKRKQYRPRLGLESLLVKSISKSSAIQRKGRAGREAPGKCWRLYTDDDYDAFEQANAPEIMRCDLADAVLKMKANGVEDVVSFPLLTPPSREAMARSLLSLYQLTALDDSGAITELGRKVSRFPLTPSYGRVLLAASDPSLDCLLACIDIISCFSADNTIFLNADTEELREEAASARASLLRRQGDHITLLAVVQGYAAENSDRKSWASARMLNHRALQGVMDIRKQLRAQCVQLKVLTEAQQTAYDEASSASMSEGLAANVLKCFLLGFRHNIARLVPDGSYRTFLGNQTVAIHPASVLFGRKVEAIVYNEFVYTNRSYARGVGVVQGSWVDEVLGER